MFARIVGYPDTGRQNQEWPLTNAATTAAEKHRKGMVPAIPSQYADLVCWSHPCCV